MTYQEYKLLTEQILNNPNPLAPYNNEMYLHYTKLNAARMKRWDKQIATDQPSADSIKSVTQPQHWIIITEPWCGDAAHIVPFLVYLASLNDMVTYDIQLRDAAPFLINQYLTNGSKGIPKLVVRDANQNDLFVWGPRPAGAAKVSADMKAANADLETSIVALQNWYNDDKGKEIIDEIAERMKSAEVR